MTLADELAGPPLDDEIERRWIVAEAEARLFGGPPAPVRVGRFEIRARIGTGGLGVVYAAFDPDLDREIALKLLRRDRSRGDDRDRDRMLREARAMARLAHPNVVPIYEVGLDEGRVFLAMERVAGRMARDWIEHTHPSWRDVVGVFVQAGRGLCAAHAAGMIHRDFKPENVLVGDDGRARVTDFGIARPAAGDDDGDATAGTPAYMAPEQHAGGLVSVASDQFAFCVALYEALYGARPFADSADIAGARVPAPSPDSVVPRRIWDALGRGLSARAEDRWPSMDALLAVLETPPRRRTLRLVVWSVVIAVLAIALIGAVIQFWMFRDWMGAARRSGPSAAIRDAGN